MVFNLSFQRLLPISNSTDLFSIPQRSAELENFPPKVYTIRPFIPSDEVEFIKLI